MVRIEGILSGTLSYIFNTYGDGRTFSEIVSEAKAKVGRGGGENTVAHPYDPKAVERMLHWSCSTESG
jgi:hypothetical protein